MSKRREDERGDALPRSPGVDLPAPEARTPFPLWPVSNGEWSPPGPTRRQRAAPSVRPVSAP